ncbi:MAG TPA: hypothetical protein VGO57_06590 [Verrucomicrobiae bacterium]|jgi:hypothetical protein
MDNSFFKFPKTCFWHEVQERLLMLPGVVFISSADDPVLGSWLDFTFREYLFTINTQSGRFEFFAEDRNCPKSVLVEIATHFESFLPESTDQREGGNIRLRRQ